MIYGIYVLSFVISALMLILLVATLHDHISIYYFLLFFLMALGNLGYLLLVSAHSVEAAVIANQIIYLNSAFVPFVVLLCMADLCKLKLPVFYHIFFVVFGSFIFFCSLTIGKLPIFYKTVSIARVGSITKLIHSYGKLHILSPIYLITTALISVLIVIYAFTHKNKVSVFVSSMISILMSITIIYYCVTKVLRTSYDFLPVVFTFVEIFLFILLRRIQLYDVCGLSTESLMVNDTKGFLLFDEKQRFVGCDETSKKWFPEIKNLDIDCKIKKSNTIFLEQLIKWMNKDFSKDFAYFEVDEKIIEVKYSIHYEDKRTIHCFYLNDDTQQQKYARLIEHYNDELENRVEEKTEKIDKIKNDIITSMAIIVEDRDYNTGGHIIRTSDVVNIFVNYLLSKNVFSELTPEFADRIIKAAPLHDFGKISVPDVILNKPGKFTPDEYEQMKSHAARGAVIINKMFKNIDECDLFKQIAENIAHYHHEKWNGTGYPSRLVGEKIPFEARIMALADVFDALVSKRVYKEKFTYDQAFEIIEESCGSHFDPILCKYFLECREQLEELYDSFALAEIEEISA